MSTLFSFDDRFGLLAPCQPWLARLHPENPPDAVQLNAWLAESDGRTAGSGQAISFSACDAQRGYEAHIHACGEVPTRADNWHDAFNALAWLAWPNSKQAINRLHARELDLAVPSAESPAARRASSRGPVRDTLTQLDEDGVIVASSDPEIIRALREFRWRDALWANRELLSQRLRLFVLGHALLDKLRQPFYGLCGKAVLREVAHEWMAAECLMQVAETDAWLARCLLADGLKTPRDLHPLPLLGLPGMMPDNSYEAYYLDVGQFRPGRRQGRADACPKAGYQTFGEGPSGVCR